MTPEEWRQKHSGGDRKRWYILADRLMLAVDDAPTLSTTGLEQLGCAIEITVNNAVLEASRE